MTYKSFTPSQAEKAKALVEEFRKTADLWVDVEMEGSDKWLTKSDMIHDCANDWDVEGTCGSFADYIKEIRQTIRWSRRSQSDVFAAIRSMGYSIRKTDWGEYRVAKRIRFHSSYEDRQRAEAGAAYCSDLAEALWTAHSWAQEKKANADFKERKKLMAGWQTRAAEILAQKRIAYGDRFATAEEAEMQQSDPLAFVELIEEYCIAEIGITSRGHWASESDIDQAAEEVALEGLAGLVESMERFGSDSTDIETAQPSPEVVAQLVEAARSARFALESAIYLQGLKALAPAVIALIDALEPFETDVEDWAESQMKKAVLSGRSDLAA